MSYAILAYEEYASPYGKATARYVTLEKGTTAEFDLTIDISELDRKSTIMAVAVPYGDTFQRYITHSVPVLLINLDKPQAEEDIVQPEYKYAE